MPGPVEIADYNPGWPIMFESERRRITEALGSLVLRVEHVGSTAVPGLAAKPTIDMMPGLSRLADGQDCIEPLQSLGYRYLGEYGIPGRFYFHDGTPRRHQLHMVVVGGEFWERHLLFRDYLRSHPEAATEYEQLKRDLAARHRDDREAYTDAKTEFVRTTEAAARAALQEHG